MIRLYVSLIYLLFGFYICKASPANDKEMHLLSQLDSVVSNLEKVDIYNQLAGMHYNTKKEISYRLNMLQLAEVTGSDSLKIQSHSSIIRNYFNRGKIDSLKSYVDTIEPYLIEQKNYRVYSFGYSLLCFAHISRRDFDEGLNILHHMHQEFAKSNSIFIEIAYNEVIGIMYRKLEGYDKSNEYFLKIWDRVKDDDDPLLVASKVQALTYLIENYIAIEQPAEAIMFIDRYADLVEEDALKSVQKIMTQRCSMFYNIMYASSYYLLNDISQFNKYCDIMERMKPVKDWYVEKKMHDVFFKKYCLLKDYEKALYHIDKSISLRPQDKKAYEEKAMFFASIGRCAESNEIMAGLFDDLRKDYDKRLTKDIDNYRISGELYRMKDESARLGIEDQTSRFWMAVTIAIAIFVILVIMILFYLKSRKMRVRLNHHSRQLLVERNNLLKAKVEIENARNKATESDRLKSAFLANMSHEIRTPLNSIVGFSEQISIIAEKGSGNDEYAELISKNSRLLLKLINNILDLSRLEAGQVRFDLKCFDACDLSQSVMDRFLQKNKMKEGLDCEYVDHGIPIHIKADRGKLAKAINILLDNSLRFTEKGYITLSVARVDGKGVLRVTDTGCGIDRKHRDVIFERFEKIDDFSQGVGLGLPICKSLVEKMNGALYINTTYCFGSQFVIELPLA